MPGLDAQTVRGSIGGNVADASGKAVSEAEVVLTSVETGRKRQTTSDRNGDFRFSSLPPARYVLDVTKSNFVKYSQPIELAVNQEIDFGVALISEGQRQQVEVRDYAPILRTESATVGGTVTTQQILDLPLDGRNYYELALLLPGVAPAAQGSAGSVRGDFAINVNGAREDANTFLLDGVYNADPKLNGVGLTSPVDAIREFEVAASTYDASFGRNAGAQINVVLKSGTNGLHGSAYYFFRNAALDARNFFTPAGGTDPRYQRSQYGFALGGPIKRDRTFLFGAWEGRRIKEGITRVTNVPTALERVGDFSQSGVPFVIDLFTQRPFPSLAIPVERVHPVGRAIAALYPLPNRNVRGANYVSSPILRDDSNSLDLRLDHSFSSKSDIMARYSFNDRDYFEPFTGSAFAQVPGFGAFVPRRAHNFVAGQTHVFSPAAINEVRFAFSRVGQQVRQENEGRNLNQQVGLPSLWSNARDNGLSAISIAGFSPLGDELNNPQSGVTNGWQINDQFTLSRGQATYRFGGEVRLLHQDAFRDVLSRGLLSFVGFTGNALSEMLQGFPAATAVARIDNPQNLRSESYNFFAQSTYRLRPNLTLTAGMRYEFNSPAVDPEDRANVYDPSSGGLVRVGTNGIPRAGYHADKNNFAPRVGIVWSPNARGTVFRAGYGVFYDQSSLAPSEGIYFSPPYYNTNLYVTSEQFFLTLSNPFPSNYPFPSPPSVFTFQRNLRTPYLQHWSFNVQQEVGRGRSLEVGYVGSKGTHLYAGRDINQATPNALLPFALRPNPRFEDITSLESRSNSNYHSLQATFQQRMTAGLSMLAAYTWSKSIDDASGFFSSAGDPNFPQDSFNTRAERARSNFDIRHRLSLTYSYALPFARTAKGVNAFLFRGWQTNGIWQFNTGRPFTVALPTDLDNSNSGRSSLGFGANDRPNVVGNPVLDNPTPERWFNTAAFAIPARGTFGNAGRNILDGPGFASINVSMLKNQRITESLTAQFRAEAFNVTNRVNLNLPDGFLRSGTFGQVTSASQPRRIQFALKFLF